MIKSLYTGITGMNAMQNALSVTSNNIANAQTVGYKKQKAVFDDLLYSNSVGAKGDGTYAGTNPKSIGNGVKLSGVSTDYSGGAITMTGGKGEVALEGNGFFVVGDSSGGNVQYTRKGSYTTSDDHYIVNGEGKYALGYPIDPETGLADTSGGLQPIQVPIGKAIKGSPSDKGSLVGNLPRNEQGTAQEFPVYNKAGDKLTMRVEMTKGQDDGTYEYTVSLRNDSKNEQGFTELTPTPKTLKFDESGELIETDTPVVRDPITGEVTSGGTVAIPFDGGTFELDLGQLTNLPTKETVGAQDVNGFAAAVIEDYQISDNGYVMATYSDGSSRAIAQLAVATFPNQDGLMKVGNGNYVATASSGIPNIGVAGQNGAGNIIGGAQEGSNVDLSVEFVDLMLYQRGFQGNTKVIKVADEILNDIVNLIR